MVDLRDLVSGCTTASAWSQRQAGESRRCGLGDLAAGADFVTSARGFMFALGCIQALKCNKNTCPTGITTHDPRLQKGLVVEEKEAGAAYAEGIVHEVETIAHSVGVAEPRQMRRRHVRIVRTTALGQMNEIYPAVHLGLSGMAKARGHKQFETALERLGEG
jgi:hypothetical protein